MELVTMIFGIAAVAGMGTSLYAYFKEKGLPWTDFKPVYILRILFDAAWLWVEFQLFLSLANIPQCDPYKLTCIVQLLLAGWVAGLAADPFVKKVYDWLKKIGASA